MKGTKKRYKKHSRRTKKGGFFSFLKKNKVAPEQNMYSTMKADTLHQMDAPKSSSGWLSKPIFQRTWNFSRASLQLKVPYAKIIRGNS